MLRPEAAERPEEARLDPARLFAALAQARGLLLAVSGGPDSLALMLLMARWREAGEAPPLFVATVDHGLREASAGEAALVAGTAAASGLPHATLVWKGPHPKAGLQEKAREARYALLAEEAERRGCDVIVTAHHADDQAETILWRLLRGSGLDGLAGMEPLADRNGLTLARPLLALAKADLVGLCAEAGLRFVDDPSNADPRFARARLRRLAPVLAAEGLDVAGLLRLGRRAARAAAALDDRAQRVASGLDRQERDDSLAFAFAPLAGEPEEIALRVMGAEIRRFASGRLRLERLERLTGALLAAFRAKRPLRATLGGVLVRLDAHGRLWIAREGPRRRGRADRKTAP